MNKVKKTSMMAMGAVAATGLAFSANAILANAEEVIPDPVYTGIVEETNTASPLSFTDAKEAADAARANAERTQAAVNEAQNQVNESEQVVANAENNLAAASQEAERAFENAKSEAQEADAHAQHELESAQKTKENAEEAVRVAEESLSDAENTLKDAEADVEAATGADPVTEADIREKESDLSAAQDDLTQAQTAVDSAKADRDAATRDLTDKENAKAAAEEALEKAAADVTEAEQRLQAASAAAEQAAQALEAAEGDNGEGPDLSNTPEYQAEQVARVQLEQANTAYEAAVSKVSEAQTAVEQARAEKEAAENALAQAEAILQEKENALASAERDKQATDAATVQARAAYDQTVEAAEKAEDDAQEAADRKAEAQQALSAAEQAKETADQEAQEAEQAYGEARQNAEAAVVADIADAAREVAEKSEAADSAARALNEVEENYKQGMLGFIDWMLAKEGLADAQIRDLEAAKSVLEEAQSKTFADFDASPTWFPADREDKVVVIGDAKDATNLENILKSIEIMTTINELRASDDNYTGDLKRDASLTSFYLMAYAQYATMRGAGIMNHSTLSVGCENLAWGYDEPTDGWYYMEKKYFDDIRDELIANGTITGVNTTKDIAAISREATKRGKVVGHYTNLMYASYQVMGVGYSQYGYTSAYNADSAVRYDGSRSSRAVSYALYTVEDFEDLLLEYYSTVNKASLQKAYNEALVEKEDAQDRLQLLIAGKDAAVEEAVKNAKDDLEAKVATADEAAKSLVSARQNLEEAEESLEQANALKDKALLELNTAQQALQEAVVENTAADTALELAQKDRDDALQSVDNASQNLEDAVDKLEEAQRILAESEEAADEADAVRAAAVLEHDQASRALDALTSDDVLNELRAKEQEAQKALQDAVAEKEEKEALLGDVLTAANAADAAVSEAKDNLAGAEEALVEAQNNYATAKSLVDAADEDLQTLLEQYVSVLESIAAHDAAAKAAENARAALAEAQDQLAGAEETLVQAQVERAKADNRLLRARELSVEDALNNTIEDDDFAYLNAYIDAIRNAQNELDEAEVNLENAKEELTARESESAEAQRAYSLALADLVCAQDQAGLIQPTVQIIPVKTVSLEDANSEPKWTGTSTDTAQQIKKASETATGDESNAGIMLELLASLGIMGAMLKRRKLS